MAGFIWRCSRTWGDNFLDILGHGEGGTRGVGEGVGWGKGGTGDIVFLFFFSQSSSPWVGQGWADVQCKNLSRGRS